MIINEDNLATISNNTRGKLENLALGGVSDWNPVFSNGYGLGDDNTLVIDMRPIGGTPDDIEEVITTSSTLLEAITQGIQNSGFGISFINLGTRNDHPGFLAIIGLKQK